MSKYPLLLLTFGLGTSACYQGYMRPEELDSAERGPKACAVTCSELGMEMSAFVLVERQTSGCVCAPKVASADQKKEDAPAPEEGEKEPKSDESKQGGEGEEPKEGTPEPAPLEEPGAQGQHNEGGAAAAAAAYVVLAQHAAAQQQQQQRQTQQNLRR